MSASTVGKVLNIPPHKRKLSRNCPSRVLTINAVGGRAVVPHNPPAFVAGVLLVTIHSSFALPDFAMPIFQIETIVGVAASCPPALLCGALWAIT